MSKQLLIAALATVLACSCAHAEKSLRVLYLTKSSGFEHSVIKREGDKLSYSERILSEIVQKMGGTITCTKDAGQINAENLKNFDVVVFCTTGILTDPGTDGQPVMGPNGVSDLLAWIKAGGGFLGFHNANDTFHSPEGSISPFVEMIGGEFAGHGPQFKGKLCVVSPKHPAIKSLEDGWVIQDEWYTSKNFNKATMHVLALLDPSKVRGKKGFDAYNQPNYPIMWCSAMEKGRILYNAMGHREDVWDNPKFQALINDNLSWVNGKGALDADPNFDKVVPKTIEPEKK